MLAHWCFLYLYYNTNKGKINSKNHGDLIYYDFDVIQDRVVVLLFCYLHRLGSENVVKYK